MPGCQGPLRDMQAPATRDTELVGVPVPTSSLCSEGSILANEVFFARDHALAVSAMAWELYIQRHCSEAFEALSACM